MGFTAGNTVRGTGLHFPAPSQPTLVLKHPVLIPTEIMSVLLSYHLLQPVMVFQGNLAGFQSPPQPASLFGRCCVSELLQTQAATAQPAQHGCVWTTSSTDMTSNQNRFWQKQPQQLPLVKSQPEALLGKVRYLSK